MVATIFRILHVSGEHNPLSAVSRLMEVVVEIESTSKLYKSLVLPLNYTTIKEALSAFLIKEKLKGVIYDGEEGEI